jgi:signal transduction histidine kinase
MIAGSLRSRLALLYAGVFLALAVVVLAIPFLAVSETVHVGSSAPPVVRHPGQDLYPQVSSLLISLAVIAAVSLGLGWLLAGRLLRPLRVIVATAQDISATNLSRRLRTGRRDDEFSRLGRTLNDLFARLEASFESQRHFVANAAHELRTPLTAERTVLQVALADPEASVATLRAACEEVLRVGEQQEKLIDALLTLASSERGIDHVERFDLAVIAATVIRDLEVGARLAPAPVQGDPWLAESLVANLAGNAVRHNVPGGWAEIETGTADGRAVLRVRNTGPVIPPADVDRLFHPFQRLGDERVRPGDERVRPGDDRVRPGDDRVRPGDERVRPGDERVRPGDDRVRPGDDRVRPGLDGGRERGGYGLGLAIVRAIAAAHGAELSASPRPEGGLDITVIFPAVPGQP